MRSVLLGLVAALCASSASADGMIGKWSVTERTSALTGRPGVTAEVDSDQQLANDIGRPERASLILRCQDGVLAFYVTWPELLSHDDDSILANLPETVVRYRLDDGPIKTDDWVMSDGRKAAGSFDNLGAPKLVKAILGGRKLVVRMGGDTLQDATFEIDGVDEVAQQIVQACGGAPRGSQPAAAVAAAPANAAAKAPGSFVVMGAGFIDVPASLGVGLRRPGLKGALIGIVMPGSVAQKSGMQVGDIVLTYGGKAIGGKDDLVAAVHATKPASSVPIQVIRGADELQLTLSY